MIKYILHPGEIISEHDGQKHFISANKLANLYKVDLRKCEIYNDFCKYGTNVIHLYPKYDGDYDTRKHQRAKQKFASIRNIHVCMKVIHLV